MLSDDDLKFAREIAGNPWVYGAAVAPLVEDLLTEREELIGLVRKALNDTEDVAAMPLGENWQSKWLRHKGFNPVEFGYGQI